MNGSSHRTSSCSASFRIPRAQAPRFLALTCTREGPACRPSRMPSGLEGRAVPLRRHTARALARPGRWPSSTCGPATPPPFRVCEGPISPLGSTRLQPRSAPSYSRLLPHIAAAQEGSCFRSHDTHVKRKLSLCHQVEPSLNNNSPQQMTGSSLAVWRGHEQERQSESIPVTRETGDIPGCPQARGRVSCSGESSVVRRPRLRRAEDSRRAETPSPNGGRCGASCLTPNSGGEVMEA